MKWVIGNEEWPEGEIIIVTGSCRSGKTLLCRLLASFNHVEWIEEPYLMSQLPIMHENKQFSDESYKTLFIAAIKEACMENLLLRNANFRPGDLSSIYNVKSTEEIEYRLKTLSNREEAQNYRDENEVIFVIDLPQIRGDVKWLLETFPKLKIINLIRNPYAVAEDIEKKGWLNSCQLIRPQNNELHRINDSFIQSYKFLWWVDVQDYDRYLNFSSYEKGIYYWIKMNEGLSHFSLFQNFKLIKYEELILESKNSISMLEAYLGREATRQTLDWSAGLWKVTQTSSDKDINLILRAELNELIMEFSYE